MWLLQSLRARKPSKTFHSSGVAIAILLLLQRNGFLAGLIELRVGLLRAAHVKMLRGVQ
jgi:hypothetical protein